MPRTNSDTNSRAITKSRKNIYIVAVENSESMEVQDWVTLQVVNLFSSRPFQVPGVYGGGGEVFGGELVTTDKRMIRYRICDLQVVSGQ